MKGAKITYSDRELAWVEAHKSLPRKEAHQMFCQKFGRTDVSMSNYAALCKRKGWLTGRTGRYEKGQIAHNKGMKMPFNPNSARTQFKKGQTPANAKPIGHERVSKDGYVELLIRQRNPHTGANRRYVHKHRHLWEKANGAIPDGHCLKCLDGDKTNTDPTNWELIPRGMLPRLNGKSGRDYDHAPSEVKPTIMAVAKLEHSLRNKFNKESGNGE